MTITLEAQIDCVKREIALRENVYPKWIESKRMRQHHADYQIAAMKDVLETLQRTKAHEAELVRNTRANAIASCRAAIERYDMPAGWRASALDALNQVRG